MNINRIILPICPQTHVRSTSGDKLVFRIPEICKKLKGGKPCHHYRRNAEAGVYKTFLKKNKTTGKERNHIGYCPHSLSKSGRERKARILKYFDYKAALDALAKEYGFVMPHSGWSWYFFFPVAKRLHKKKALMHGQHHFQRPDLNNLEKAAEDSLSVTDEKIAQRSGHGKFWIDPDQVEDKLRQGYIEIFIGQPVYNPFNVDLLSPVEQEQVLSVKQSYPTGVTRKKKIVVKDTLF